MSGESRNGLRMAGLKIPKFMRVRLYFAQLNEIDLPGVRMSGCRTAILIVKS